MDALKFSIWGTIENSKGYRLANCNLRFARYDGNTVTTVLTTTDKFGQFLIAISPGCWRMSAYYCGSYTSSVFLCLSLENIRLRTSAEPALNLFIKNDDKTLEIKSKP